VSTKLINAHQPISQPANQPTIQPANHSTSQPFNQPTIQPANHSTYGSVSITPVLMNQRHTILVTIWLRVPPKVFVPKVQRFGIEFQNVIDLEVEWILELVQTLGIVEVSP
jgi:hypothetical protein